MAENMYYGIYKGVVTNIKDPEKRGRIKVRCPEVLGADTESAWCDPCVPIAYDNGGDICIPKLDETVWLMFFAGDSNKPVYLGGWWSKEKTLLGTSNYDTLAPKTRIIEYGKNKITMTKDDKLVIENSKQAKVTVENNTAEVKIGGNTITIKSGEVNINIGTGTTDLKIEEGKVTVTGNLIVTGNVTNTNGTITTKTVNASGTVTANNVTASNDVTASGKSLKSHTHSYSWGHEAGSGNTSAPN